MRLSAALIALTCACASFKADAQTYSPLAEWQFSAGRALEPYFVATPPTWEHTLGLPVEQLPRYEGGTKTRVLTGLVAEIRYLDIAFASTVEGVGVNLLHGKGYRAGLALTYDIGRYEHTDPALAGMGDLRPAPETKAFAEYVLFPVVLRGDVRRTYGGHGGWTGDLGAYMPVIGSEKFFLLLGPALTWIDRDNARRSFGVSQEQAARSGYPVYNAGGGLSAVQLGAAATWFMTDSWFADLSGAEEWLERAAANSPLVRDRREETYSLTLGYLW